MAYVDTSAYKEKYRWTGYDTKNQQVQLRILQRSSSSFVVKEIGGLSALLLSLQGGQGGVFAPVVKTSLSFTLVDMPSKSTSSMKHGDWQEFYTPDSTLYMVELYRYNDAGSFALNWRGFITPDSWQESLAYGGSITIVARDNLGHLQDFEFDSVYADYNGTTRICDLVYEALDKIEFPMDLTIPWTNSSSGATHLRDTHDWLLNTRINAAKKFEGENWWTAVTKSLEAIGYCLRFTGAGAFSLLPIRNLPLRGYETRSEAQSHAYTLEFYGGDRSNDPAYKNLKDVVDFDSEDEVELPLSLRLDLGNSVQSYSGRMWNPPNWKTFTGYHVRNTSNHASQRGGWIGGNSCFGFMRPDLTALQSTLQNEDGSNAMKMGVNLSADLVTGIDRTYRVYGCRSTDITINCEFARPVESKTNSYPYTMARLKDYMKTADMYIKYTDPLNSTVFYWNGAGWQTESYLLEVDIAEAIAESYKFSIPLSDISAQATLGGFLDIDFFNFHNVGEDTPDCGSYVRLTAIKVKLNVKSVLKSDTVTTVNNQDYNVKVERKPEFGAMSAQVSFFSADNYPGALWTYDNNGILIPYDYASYFSAFSSTTAIPLPAQIHKQMLCFNHISLTALEGNCGLVNKSKPLDFNEEFYYKGRYYILQSGTLDVLKNRLSSAILHEYIWYPNLWDESSNPTYAGVPKFETNSGSGDASVGQSGGGGGGTVTSVGISVPTGLKTSGSPITTAGTIAITLDSGYTIPTSTDVNKGVTAYGWGNHANAGYITGITYNMVISALGYTPASSSALSDLSHRVDLAEQDIDYLEDIVAELGDPHCQSAPKLKIWWGHDSMQYVKTPIMEVEHPLIGKDGVDIVLMTWRKRRGRHASSAHLDYVLKPKYHSGWGEAKGQNLASATPLLFSTSAQSTNDHQAYKTLDDLRTFILHNYVCGLGYTEAQIRAMSLSTFFQSDQDTFAFGGKHNYSGTASSFLARTKRSQLFGVAIRYTNPAFTAALAQGHSLVETTRSIPDPDHQGRYIPRYFYSEVVPFRAFIHTTVDEWVIGFQLQIAGAPRK